MIRKAVGVLAGLGLVGGAGTVAYDHHGNATVKIKDTSSGIVHTVHIGGGGGPVYSCPAGEHNKLSKYDITLARIKLTQQPIRNTLREIERRYPDHRAPAKVASRFNALLRRDQRLVRAYNAEVDARNAILHQDCSTG